MEGNGVSIGVTTHLCGHMLNFHDRSCSFLLRTNLVFIYIFTWFLLPPFYYRSTAFPAPGDALVGPVMHALYNPWLILLCPGHADTASGLLVLLSHGYR